MWVELTSDNLEYLRMAVLVNAGKHAGSDASRKWHAGKYSRARVRREAKENKRRRLPSSDTDGKDDDDEERMTGVNDDSEVSANSVTSSHS